MMTTPIFLEHVQQLLAELKPAVRYGLTGQVTMDEEGDLARDISLEPNAEGLEHSGKGGSSYMLTVEKDLSCHSNSLPPEDRYFTLARLRVLVHGFFKASPQAATDRSSWQSQNVSSVSM